MRGFRFTILWVLAVCALAQLSAASTDNSPPSYDLKPQALQDLQVMQKQFADLAEAIPAEKFTWRPGEGTRSVGEVFLHVASTNFSLAPNFGADPVSNCAIASFIFRCFRARS